MLIHLSLPCSLRLSKHYLFTFCNKCLFCANPTIPRTLRMLNSKLTDSLIIKQKFERYNYGQIHCCNAHRPQKPCKNAQKRWSMEIFIKNFVAVEASCKTYQIQRKVDWISRKKPLKDRLLHNFRRWLICLSLLTPTALSRTFWNAVLQQDRGTDAINNLTVIIL